MNHKFLPSLSVAWTAVWAGLAAPATFGQFADPIPVTEPVVTAASGIAEDVDGDGRIDLVHPGPDRASIRLTRGLGGAVLASPTVLFSGAQIQSLLSADMDGDGDRDLLFEANDAAAGGNAIFFLRREAAGYAANAVLVGPTDPAATGFFVGDQDGDGDLDVISRDSGGQAFIQTGLALHENLGGGVFAPRRIVFTVPQGSLGAADGEDLNGDGILDLVAASGGALRAYYGSLAGIYSAPQTLFTTPSGSRVSLLEVKDADGDLDADVVFSIQGGLGLQLVESLGTQGFAAAVEPGGVPARANSFQFHDINLDGRVDVVVSSDEGIFYYAGQPGGGLATAAVATQSDNTRVIGFFVGDFTGDGVADVASTVSSGPWRQLHLWTHFGNALAPLIDAPRPFPGPLDALASVAMGNLNAESSLEYLVWESGAANSNEGNLAAFEQTGDQGTPVRRPLNHGSLPGPVASFFAADLDGNGLDDLVVTTEFDQLFVVPTVAPFELGTPVFVGPVAAEVQVRAEDLDRDGDLDLVGAGPSLDIVLRFDNLGAQSFGLSDFLFNPDGFITSIDFADLDADGDRDLIASERIGAGAPGRVLWAPNQGGVFGSGVFVSGGSGAGRAVSSADVNGDGLLDLIWTPADSGSQQTQVLWARNLGAGAFVDEGALAGTSARGGTLLAADLDLDGDTDLVSLSVVGTVHKMLNNGAGVFAPEVVTLDRVFDLALKDRDSDGEPDLLLSLRDEPVAVYSENETIGSIGQSYCGPAVTNASGAAAEIAVAGSSVVSLNSLQLVATDLPTSTFGYFLVSQQQDQVFPVPGSIGRLCLGGAIGRFVGPGEVQNSGPSGHFVLDASWTQLPQPNGPAAAAAGQTWNFQAWFRDTMPAGGATSNFTNGVSVTLE